MAVVKDNFEDFNGQEEVQIKGKPQIKLFKKGNKFIGFLQSIKDNPLESGVDNGYGKKVYGNKVFTFIAISGKDERSADGTAAGDPINNPIIPGEEYNFFTNYNKPSFLDVNGAKLSALPLGAVVKLENMGKKKSEKSSFSYNDISIIGKKDDKGNYVIHPDYKAIDDFDGQDEVSVEDIPW